MSTITVLAVLGLDSGSPHCVAKVLHFMIDVISVSSGVGGYHGVEISTRLVGIISSSISLYVLHVCVNIFSVVWYP